MKKILFRFSLRENKNRMVMMADELDMLALRFFKLFAQYEFYMKSMGYFQVSRTKIIVDWDRFVNEKIGKDYAHLLGETLPSGEYILQNPPKKQEVVNGKVVWGNVSNNEQNVQVLFGYIGRVRNNLFHGAKFNGTWFDPERSKILLEHSLNILEHFQKQGVLADLQ
ncbi:TPA: hypothetical protein JD893_23490 [Citrobacter freundii]|nr:MULTISPECIES: hypothetical protein [Citrobacter]MDH0217240.1 hypothetical protein [Citrobacter freundii]MDH0228578.1 hypothetical protein [Citrobacter freundii]MDH0242996.1 hypothetical protein [Citrobacter freundii]MDH1350732.1 hypothetical protein [Citrobacter freundii]MDH1382995.1 hypothetical protein [Citrobacter freundii]